MSKTVSKEELKFHSSQKWDETQEKMFGGEKFGVWMSSNFWQWTNKLHFAKKPKINELFSSKEKEKYAQI